MFVWLTYVLELYNFLPPAMESSSPPKEPKCILYPPRMFFSEGKLVAVPIFFLSFTGYVKNSKKAFDSVSDVPTEDIPEGSSFTAGERMHELVKVCLVPHLFSCYILLKLHCA